MCAAEHRDLRELDRRIDSPDALDLRVNQLDLKVRVCRTGDQPYRAAAFLVDRGPASARRIVLAPSIDPDRVIDFHAVDAALDHMVCG